MDTPIVDEVRLTTRAEMPRGMTTAEAYHYLMFDELPDVTKDPTPGSSNDSNAQSSVSSLPNDVSLNEMPPLIADAFKFDPNQPRWPSGSSEGGQWRDSTPDVTSHKKISLYDEVLSDGSVNLSRNDKLRSLIEKAYNFNDEKSGLNAKISKISVKQIEDDKHGNGFVIAITGTLTKDGEHKGDFTRRLFSFKDKPEASYARHEFLELDDDVQGGGFSQRFNDNVENEYRNMDIKKIRLHANISVGGYAWAIQGYDFDSFEGMWKAYDRVRNSLISADVPFDDKGFKSRMTKEHFEAGTHPKPLEFALLGKDHIKVKDGRLTWPGKRGMLGSRWDGVKDI